MLALGSGENPVVIDVHLVEVRQKGVFELLPGHGLKAGEPPLEEAQGVPADARRNVPAGRSAQQQQFPADSAGLLAGDEAIAVDVELIEPRVGTLERLLASQIRLLFGRGERLRRRLSRGNGGAERRNGDDCLHARIWVPELNRHPNVPIAECLSSQTLQHWPWTDGFGEMTES